MSRAATLPPSRARSLEIWEPQLLEPSGPVQACDGFALIFTYLYTTVPTKLSDAAVQSEDVCGIRMTSALKKEGER